MKKSLTIIGIILLTVVLAVLSVVTAIRIRNLGTQPVAPNAPESKPKAEGNLPPDDLQPKASCKTTFQVGGGGGVVCQGKIAHRNDSRNAAGGYFLTTASIIPDGETVSKGEIIVFVVSHNPKAVQKNVTTTDILPSSLEFIDTDHPGECTYASSTKTLTCTSATTGGFAFRAKVTESAGETITNTAKVQAEGDPESTCSITLKLAGEEITPTPTPTPTPTGTITPTPGKEAFCESLHANKAGGAPPLAVTFEGKGYDPTRIKGFRFNFGDGSDKKEFFGSFTSDQVQETSHTYTEEGTYKATLEIMDDGDRWRTRPECTANINVSTQITSTPKPTKIVSPTEVTLPVAGLKLPTLGGIIAGFLLISLGAALVF